MKPIYEPKGKAKEYGDYAINIYTGCPHRCYYCFAPNVLRRDRETFHSDVRPRDGIVEAVKLQLEKEQIKGKLIHLCFTCDPFPNGYDQTHTREIIKLIKSSGNNVQILTKNPYDAVKNLDLLDGNDWLGISYDGNEDAMPYYLIEGGFEIAKLDYGINTWVSCEPVINADNVLDLLADKNLHIDRYKIGKLNYYPSDINWADFGKQAENICKKRGLDYYIKDSLRQEMNK